MRYYEMLFIVHPNYEQDRLDAEISSVQKEITAKGGTVLKTDNWGKRKLAYLINKQRYGSYVLMYFEADPAMIQGLQEWMEIQAQVLHQMIIRLDEKPELSAESENPDSPSSAPYVKKPEFVKSERTVKAPEKEAVEESAVEEVIAEEAVAEEEVAEEEVAEEAVVEESAVEEAVDTEETTEEKGV